MIFLFGISQWPPRSLSSGALSILKSAKVIGVAYYILISKKNYSINLYRNKLVLYNRLVYVRIHRVLNTHLKNHCKKIINSN